MRQTLPIKYKKLTSDKLFLTTAIGFLLRLALLIFMLTVGQELFEPYFLEDDIKYETLAEIYMNSARSVIDFTVFDNITAGYLELFWPWVLCICAYIFKTIYFGRYINIVLSALCIPLIHNITMHISGNKKTAMRSAMLFAYLPLTLITCCFPIKDIFITFAVLFAFDTFLKIQNGTKLKIHQTILCILLLIAVYFTRGAVTEMLLIFFMVYLTHKLIKKKNYFAVIASAVVIIMIFLLFGSALVSEFTEKIDSYSVYNESDGSSASLRIKSITEIYKLPFSYFFATLHPLRMNYFSKSMTSFWLDLISYLNITVYPIAIGNFLYIVKKKKNFFFWLSTLILFCSVIILSFGIFRHYLFLFPVHLINFSLFLEEDSKTNLLITVILSAMMLMGIFMLSMLTV